MPARATTGGGAAERRRPFDPLYDATATGMGVYMRTAYRVEVLGRRSRWRLPPGTLIVSTHRAETDVPLVASSLYFAGRMWLHRRPRMHFAARDDLFERGFLAGFPPGLGPRTRRALFPLSVGRFLPLVRAHPIGSATSLSLARALAALPAGATLGLDLLPPRALDALAERAAELGRPAPRTVGEARRGDYADVLLQRYERSELTAPALDAVWRRRLAEATRQLRALVDVMRDGEPLVLFPEGQASPDGAIGPLLPGLGALVRRGAPASLQPLAISYDPLRPGRTRAFMAFGAPLAPPAADVETAVLRALRRATPLTCGGLVAGHLAAAAASGRSAVPVVELEEALDAAVRAALREGRPVERALVRPGPVRGRRLDEPLAVLAGIGAVAGEAVDAPRALAFEPLARAAREHASARDLG